MSNILYVTSSPRGDASYSNRLANYVVGELQRANPQATVIVRDLAVEPLPHIDDDFAVATRAPGGPQTDRQRAVLAKSDELVDELLAADTIVIAAPMINFGVASTLKSWIDYIARPRRTFSYSEAGPEGLVTGKRVIIAVATGGVYSSGDNAASDFQVPWLKHALGFLGMTDVEVVRVEGTAFGPDAATKAVERAHTQARDIVAALAA
ncbi:MAG: FMN-dependent NADH-azoreductase [Xanthobacteraceae bacterium]